MKHNKAYCRKRGDVWLVEWVDGSTIRSESFPSEKEARVRRVTKTEELLGVARDVVEPKEFSGAIQGRSGGSGKAWVDLLWAATALVAQNPGCERQQRALRSVASAAVAARKFMSQDQVYADGDDDISDSDYIIEIGKMLEPMLHRAGISNEGKEAVIQMLKPGKQAAVASKSETK